ncbi:hypothetical protein MRX96_030748 [Rhipicephalus microplus]
MSPAPPPIYLKFVNSPGSHSSGSLERGIRHRDDRTVEAEGPVRTLRPLSPKEIDAGLFLSNSLKNVTRPFKIAFQETPQRCPRTHRNLTAGGSYIHCLAVREAIHSWPQPEPRSSRAPHKGRVGAGPGSLRPVLWRPLEQPARIAAASRGLLWVHAERVSLPLSHRSRQLTELPDSFQHRAGIFMATAASLLSHSALFGLDVL